MILIIDLILLVYLLAVWFSIAIKWRTIYVSQDPTNTYWNHVYIDPKEDASIKIQAAINFLGRLGGTIPFGQGTYSVKNTIELKGRTHLRGESSQSSASTAKEVSVDG